MKFKDTDTRGIEPTKQLELLKLQCNSLAPNLYRTYALYLQILRSLLLNSVRNAILSLITREGYYCNDSSTTEKSRSCQLIVDKLVARCNSLLTIEHIIDLTRQIDRENKIIMENASDQISSAIKKDKSLNYESLDDRLNENNIHLESHPPIDNPSQIDSWFISDDFGENYNSDDIEYQNELEQDAEPLDSSYSNPDSRLDETDKTSFVDKNKKLDVLKSLFSIASQAFEPKDQKGNAQKEDQTSIVDRSPDDLQNAQGKEYLPDNPQALADWISSFELALSRRLRNLSHALNVELLRAGIVNSIVPVSILDAVLSGQMSSQYADSHLLRIYVPTSPSSPGEGIDIVCLLIRLSELEFDNPRLRSCRTALKKHQKQILKMVRQERHWQSRSLAYELQRSWWQNPTESSPKNLPKN